MDHDKITAALGGVENYGKGITPNPFAPLQKEWTRRKEFTRERALITAKIESVFEPRFLTPPETSECIEAIVTMTDSRQILECGTHIGFTSLHILRAIVGKEGAKLVSIDARPAHDKEFFARPGIAPHWEFIGEWTPKAFEQLRGRIFDLCFIDSDHSVEHTSKEVAALWPLTREGSIFVFHDLPFWASPTDRRKPAVRQWVEDRVALKSLNGWIFPNCEQLDCLDAWGSSYPPQCNPHLGLFVRGAELK